MYVLGGRGVAAHQAVLAELPDLAAPGPGFLGRIAVVVVLAHGLEFRLRPQPQPRGIEARDADVEAGGLEGLHLGAQDGFVGSALGEQIVGVHKGPPLGLAQTVDLDAGEVGVAALPGGKDPAVPVDQVAGGVDPGRDDAPELIEAADELVDLLLRVQLCVVFVWDQLVDLPPHKPDVLFHAFSSVKSGHSPRMPRRIPSGSARASS